VSLVVLPVLPSRPTSLQARTARPLVVPAFSRTLSLIVAVSRQTTPSCEHVLVYMGSSETDLSVSLSSISLKDGCEMIKKWSSGIALVDKLSKYLMED
jgi:hypothetical protein